VESRIAGRLAGSGLIVAPAQQFDAEPRLLKRTATSPQGRAIVRLPNAEAAELRKLDSERLDDMFLSLQQGIRQGDPRSIEVSVRVLALKAEINGYKTPVPSQNLIRASGNANSSAVTGES
jgi:hypothetical protein